MSTSSKLSETSSRYRYPFDIEVTEDEPDITVIEADVKDRPRVVKGQPSAADNLTQYSRDTKRSEASSRKSERRIEMEAKAAKLEVELKYHKSEAEKQAELKKIRMEKELAITRAEIEVAKSESLFSSEHSKYEEGNRDQMNRYLEEQLNSVKRDRPNNVPQTRHQEESRVPSGDTTEGTIHQLVDLLSKRWDKDSLPKPEPDKFDGNLLNYADWISSFENLVESKNLTSKEKMYYLGVYTTGEAKEAIQGFIHSKTPDAYRKAKKLIKDRFGNQFSISRAFREKLDNWPKIRPNDGNSLRKFSDFLLHSQSAMEKISYLEILNDPNENGKLLKKLPNYMVNRWSRIVDNNLEEIEFSDDEAEEFPRRPRVSRYPSFTEFCNFVKKEARIACNPVTSNMKSEENAERARDKDRKFDRPKKRQFASFSTGAKEEQESSQMKDRPQEIECLFCHQQHCRNLDRCKEFVRLSLLDRRHFIKTRGLCHGCLQQGHMRRSCPKKMVCDICQWSHPTCLHDQDLYLKLKKRDITSVVSNCTKEFGYCLKSHSLIVPVELFHEDNPANRLMVYAVLDEQSDACFGEQRLQEHLSLKGTEVNLNLSTVMGEHAIKSTKISGLVIRGVNEDTQIHLPPIYTRDVIPTRRDQIPRPETCLKWPHLQQIAPEIMPYRNDIGIGLLIGINCIKAIKPREVIPGNDDEPYAIKTLLGWGIIGMVDPDCHKMLTQDSNQDRRTHIVFKTEVKELINQVNQMFNFDFNDRDSDTKAYSQEDKRFLKTMEDGIKHLENNHYQLPLPLKSKDIQLPNNKELAVNRLVKLKKRLKSDENYRKDYCSFMEDLIAKGYAEKSQEDPHASTSWFIPHHGVYHPKKAKIRVVFDCSATYQGRSLNNSLLQGPDLTNNLMGVLCRFRKEPVAFTCDIQAMFYQVVVEETYRNYLKFLWWENSNLDEEPTEYRMTVHLFGATSSPSCSNFALRRTADDFKEDHGVQAADFVQNDFYVDDGLKSIESTEEAICLINATKELCIRGGFKLHKIVSNSKEVLRKISTEEQDSRVKDLDLTQEDLPIERALGVQWCIESDTLQFRINLKDQPLTRRGILSTVSSVFDPLGMVSPFVLIGKRILQQLCHDGIDWDEKVPDSIRPQWERWRTDILLLADLQVPRCYKPKDFGEPSVVEIHHFADACNEGYGQCSYLRLQNKNKEIHCCLILAKSRVTPLKPVTIPRLELAAAVISVKISEILSKELRYSIPVSEVFYTDSQVVLGYIKNEARRFHTFVANRVQKIRDHTSPDQWKYIESKNNPADDASRGLWAHNLVNNTRWWKGPEFLWNNQEPQDELQDNCEICQDDPEVKSVAALKVEVNPFPSIIDRLSYFSDWHRARRAVAYAMRLLLKPIHTQDHQIKEDEANDLEITQDGNEQRTTQDKTKDIKNEDTGLGIGISRHKNQRSGVVPVTVMELQKAEIKILKLLQAEHFQDTIDILKTNQDQNNKYTKTSIYRLDPFLDPDGILRVGGRIRNAPYPDSMKQPIIIPKKSHITTLIICYFHNRIHHQGRGITHHEIRSAGFWIVDGSSCVGHHINRCIKCRKLRGTKQNQKMANLPEDRLTPSPPFTYSSVDYFGPFMVKERRSQLKRYGVLFTCNVSRAIHLETASDMTSDAFINAYRRFVGRRGPIRQLRSDQGSNFIGARSELKTALQEMNKDKVRAELLKDGCDWYEVKMNVPYSSHMGGVWERQIRTVRSILSSLMDQHGTQLDDESLRTFMVEAESIVNNRPLTTISTDPNQPISPNHLLTSKSKVLMPPPGVFQRNDLYLRKRWRKVQYLANQFWNTWRKQYLQSLQERQKWSKPHKNLQVDDIVLVSSDNEARNTWKLARVNEVFVEDDGLVRKVRLQIADSSLDKDGKRTQQPVNLERPIHKLVLLISKDEEDRVNPHQGAIKTI